MESNKEHHTALQDLFAHCVMFSSHLVGQWRCESKSSLTAVLWIPGPVQSPARMSFIIKSLVPRNDLSFKGHCWTLTANRWVGELCLVGNLGSGFSWELGFPAVPRFMGICLLNLGTPKKTDSRAYRMKFSGDDWACPHQQSQLALGEGQRAQGLQLPQIFELCSEEDVKLMLSLGSATLFPVRVQQSRWQREKGGWRRGMRRGHGVKEVALVASSAFLPWKMQHRCAALVEESLLGTGQETSAGHQEVRMLALSLPLTCCVNLSLLYKWLKWPWDFSSRHQKLSYWTVFMGLTSVSVDLTGYLLVRCRAEWWMQHLGPYIS